MSVLCFVNSGGAFTQQLVNTVADCQLLNTGLGVFIAQPPEAQAPTLQDIFAIPLMLDLQTMWITGFSTPVICYLASWGLGLLINMFKTRNHD